ncbi:probable inactive receptor kinase At2g26730 [Aristolochia californica]|uniref:probable inactive receptor kinase At2g26730 n=1 Tax=Aristolochia californica TaxID=171875 RepID=UPI0035DB54D1
MNFGLIIFICYFVGAIQSPVITAIGIEEYYSSEREALIQLRESIHSNLDLHSVWTGPPCIDNSSKWVGIECLNSHVIHILLEGVEMTGFLPPTFLQNITYLSVLSFRNNSLFGHLPNLTNLNHLQNVIFSQNSFSGSIPLEYTELQGLERLELEENHLTGEIPPFDQQSLVVFNVSHNQLEGLIPQTPVLTKFPSSSYDRNSGLCGNPLAKKCPFVPPGPGDTPPPLSPAPSDSGSTPSKNKMLRIWIIVLIAVAALLVPIGLMLLFLCYHRRAHRKEAKADESGEVSGESSQKNTRSSESYMDPERRIEMEFFDKERPVFDLDDLLRASAVLMGKGKLGSTYKAVLESGSVVTVKRLKDMNGLSRKDFVQQMHLIGKMKHENLVQIISFYYSKEEKLVVYEYIPDGSLFELLHGYRSAGRVPLDWAARLSIVEGIAKGLAYLHQSLPSHKVPHANLKSSNVLISRHEGRYQPKLTDFGFQPLLSSRKSMEKLAMVRSPEVSQGKKLNHKVDVYCFGILLLEVVTGRIPGEFSPVIEGPSDDLSEWVREVVKQDWSTEILDLEIVGAKEGHGDMLKLTEIALQCTNVTPEQRPKMSEVLRRIEEMKQETNPAEPQTESQSSESAGLEKTD